MEVLYAYVGYMDCCERIKKEQIRSKFSALQHHQQFHGINVLRADV